MSLQAILTPVQPNAPGDLEFTVATIPAWVMAGLVEDAGWLLCNGAIITNTGRYANLFALLAALGHPFGGTGKLPYLIDGWQPAAAGPNQMGTIGQVRGASSVQLSLAQIAGHVHSYSDYYASVGASTNNGMGDTQLGTADFARTTNAAGGGGFHNNMSPYVVVEGVMVKL